MSISLTKYIKRSVTLLLITGSVAAYFGFTLNRAQAQKPAKTAVKSAIFVKVTHVQKEDMPSFVDALGSLSAVQKVSISAEVSGRITGINFKNGQQVGKGMPIVQLDNGKAQADYQSAVTALKLSQTKYDRSKSLVNVAISKQELAQLQADVQSKQADVKKAQTTLNQKEIVAPFAGVLGAFSVNVGDFINAGDDLVTLVNTQQLRVDYSIPETYVPKLKLGQLVRLTVSAYPNKVFYGTVTFISPTIDASTRSVSVQAVVSNTKGLLSPGMFVRVSQQIDVTKGALTIPADAVMADVKGYYVYKVINGKAVQTYVTVGSRQSEKAQITKGVTSSDVIVLAGQQKLNDGSSVKVIVKT